MMKLFLLVFLLFAAQADRFASDSGSGSTCSIGSPCSVGTAISGATPGVDTVKIRTGSYPQLTDASITWPSTSAGAILIIENYNGEVVTFNGFNQNQTTTDYTIFRGLIFSCTGDFNECVGTQGNNLRFENVTCNGNNTEVVEPNSGNCLIINEASHHIVWSGGRLTNPGFGPGCEIFSCDGYPAYVKGSDNIIEHALIDDFRGYGIHNFCTGGGCGSNPARNIYRFNTVKNGCQGLNTCTGILLGTGADNAAYGNVIYDITGTGSGAITGIHFGNSATNALIYNNTIVDSKFAGISWDASASGGLVKNNLLSGNTRDFYNTSEDDDTIGSVVTGSNNRGDGAHTLNSTTAAIGFVNAGTDDYRLALGSAMIDAGATLGSPYNVDYLGVTRPQGASYDIGAYEFAAGSVATPRQVKAIIVE